MSIILRIVAIQEEQHPKSQRAFELSIGKTSGYLNMIKKRNSVPGVDVINKIIEVYPKYSLQWLMTGKGDKYSNTEHILTEPLEIYGKEIPKTDFIGLSQRIDVVINQNNEILETLNRRVAKKLIKKELKNIDKKKS